MEAIQFDFPKYQENADDFTKGNHSVWDKNLEIKSSSSFSDYKGVFDFENILKSNTIKPCT
jgi:hypothetical protein